MVRGKDDEQWQVVKEIVRVRDKTCRLCAILTPVEYELFKKSKPSQAHLDSAHVLPVSAYPGYVYNPDNIYLLCRTHHHRIDDWLSPVTGKSISHNRHYWWWWRVIKKSTQDYDKNIDYEDLVKSYIKESQDKLDLAED